MAKFGYIADDSAQALAQFAITPGATARLDGQFFAQGLFGALVASELMAANAGVVPFVEAPDGNGGMVRGVVAVGSARERIENPASWTKPHLSPSDTAEGVRTLYLGSHGAVRRAHAATRDVTPPGVHVVSGVGDIGFIPVAVYLVALGVAAIVATAYYATETKRVAIETDGENLRQAARVAAAVKAADAEMALTGKVSPALWNFLRGEADAEAAAKDPLSPQALAIGGLVLAGAGYAAYQYFGGARRVR